MKQFDLTKGLDKALEWGAKTAVKAAEVEWKSKLKKTKLVSGILGAAGGFLAGGIYAKAKSEKKEEPKKDGVVDVDFEDVKDDTKE